MDRTTNAEAKGPRLTSAEFQLFRDYIVQHSGIHFDEKRLSTLEVSLLARMSIKNLGNFREYYRLLKAEPEGENEFRELLSLLTINETSFFRNPPHFDILRNDILPDLITERSQGDRTLKIWSAGCSTGEEPYSIAMVVRDLIPRVSNFRIEIWGTDIDKRALWAAQRAVYSERALRNMAKEYRARYFRPVTSNKYELDKSIRNMVTFSYANLAKDTAPLSIAGSCDVIFCRNVIIYFDPQTTRRVISTFHDSVRPGGYLFVGHSETLTQFSTNFALIMKGETFLYRKEDRRAKASAGLARVDRERTRPARQPDVWHRLRSALSEKGEEAAPSPPEPTEPRGSDAAAEEEEPAAPLTPRQAIERLHEQALAQYRAGSYEQAERVCGEILQRDGDHVGARLLLASFCVNQGQYDRALEECDRVTRISPLSHGAYFLRGTVYAKQQQRDRAVREYRRAIYLNKDFALAYFNLANLHRDAKRYDDAVREYRNAMRAIESKSEDHTLEFFGGISESLLLQGCKKSIELCSQRAES